MAMRQFFGRVSRLLERIGWLLLAFIVFSNVCFFLLIDGFVHEAEIRDGVHSFWVREGVQPYVWQSTNWFLYWWWKVQHCLFFVFVAYLVSRFVLEWLMTPEDERK
ncbi:hypothetical protein [Phycobacter sp. K97]|uniref:hypothetical protein n=1 Tax=Phycobacter sedimenti TaxID=3133977 RepID=UPI00311EEB37